MYLKRTCSFALIVFAAMCSLKVNAQTLVWSDEFSQPKLDVEKWTTEVGGGGFGNGELQYYTSGESNIFIGSKTNPTDTGYLVIEARRENYGFAPENRQFTSGRLNTSGKFNFKYGTVEARIKLPDLQNGLWPAFWMLGANYPTVGWPRSGEIDILEAGFRDDWQNGIANKKVNTTVHWFQDNFQTLDPNAPGDGWWGNASANNNTTIAGSFNDGFHVFKLTWTPTEIQGFVDGIHYYSFTIPQGDPNFTEFSNPFYIIMNLAVGGSNFVGISDPAQITAPMPAQMQVDYVRVYANENTDTFEVTSLPRENGVFGVYTETTSVTNSLGDSPTIEVWSNLTAASSLPQEGSNVLAFTANPGNWFGMGIPTGTVRNMENFIDGTLHFQMKTTSAWPMSVGIISTANGNAQASTQSKSVKLDPAGNQYGLVRDGEWHEVVIPFSAFGNIEFRSINNMFYLVGDNPSAPVTFAIDNIYWVDGAKITPQNGDFVIYSDTHAGVDSFDLGADGQFYVWENTLTILATTPSEGANALSYTNTNKGWFGAAFTASAMYNLTAFQNSDAKLVFSLKTSDANTPFYIGMKSGTRDGEGQKWIAFEAGQTPYGFQRNGTWQTVQVPMSDLYDAVNLMEVTQMFEILGIGNITDIAIDNIYLTGGGTALPDVGSNAIPIANAGTNITVRPPANSVVISGSATDSDGTIVSYVWTVETAPSSPVLAGDSTATLTASELASGMYVFRLTVTDDEGSTGHDDVTVFVGPNIPPAANAGIDRTISAPADSVALTGGGSDADGTITSYLWSLQSGPNVPALIGNTTSVLSVSGLTEGSYLFKLAVTDNEGATSDDTVRVNVTPNAPPTANAGADQSITLPANSITLTGSGSDTGIITGYSWSVVSAPAAPALSGQNTATVTLNNLVAGSYVLGLTVTDNGDLTGYDQVIIVVNEAPVNLAFQKPVTVSSVENAGTPGQSAVDGNMGTRWASAFSDPQWIYVDLGASYVIDRVKISWEAAYGKNYVIEVSDDASNWTTLKTVTGNTSTINDHSGLSGAGRYVRIYGTVRATPYGYSIYELEVYGSPNNAPTPPTANAGNDQTIVLPNNSTTLSGSGSDVDGSIVDYSWAFVSGPGSPTLAGQNTPTLSASNLVSGSYLFRLTVTDTDSLTASDDVTIFVSPAINLALQKPVMFSSAESNGTLGAQAVDGNLATRWSSAFTDPQWIYVDLGAIYSIERVKITWEAAYGKDYQIQLSEDALSWETIKSVVGNNTTINDHIGLSGAGRYVRIYGTSRATPWGYSIYEIEVYGGMNSAPVANAGTDVLVNLPDNSVALNGSGVDADGAIVSYVWNAQSGPNGPALSGDSTATLTVNGLVAGTYVFALTVTDNNGAIDADEVTVFVNNPPTANAGDDRIVVLPSDTVILNGSAIDIDGVVSGYNWTTLSGPDAPTFLNDSTEDLSVMGLIAGTYTFRLTAIDNYGAVANDEVSVEVIANTPPVVNAGEDITIALPTNEVILNGIASDSLGSISSYLWTVQTGPNAPVLSATDSSSVTASGLHAGTYVFRLTVTDNGGLSAYDEITVVVNYGTSSNLALHRPATASSELTAETNSSQAVDGNPNTFWNSAQGEPQWIFVDLEASYRINRIKINWASAYGKNFKVQVSSDLNSWTTLKTIKGNKKLVNDYTGLKGSGRYVRIYGTMSGISGSYAISELEVYGTPNAAPLANAGPDVTIALPAKNVVLRGMGTDSDGTIVKYSWKSVSGPNMPRLAGATSRNVTVNGMIAGTYVFRLTVTDNGGVFGTDDVAVVVHQASSLAAREAVQTMEAENESEVEVYPIPANSVLHVPGLKDGSEVRIMTITGSQAYHKLAINQAVDISDVPPGLYILDGYSEKGILRKKFIKE